MKTAGKMAIDLMSSPTAASLFYTNDIKVLIDVLTRFVTDLGPDEVNLFNFIITKLSLGLTQCRSTSVFLFRSVHCNTIRVIVFSVLFYDYDFDFVTIIFAHRGDKATFPSFAI